MSPQREFDPSRSKLFEIIRKPFITEVVHAGGGLRRAAVLMNEGYGLLIVINHSEFQDTIHTINFADRYPELRRKQVADNETGDLTEKGRRFGSGISMHHWESLIIGSIVQHTTPEMGVEMFPIVNESTVSKGKAYGRRRGYGLPEFIDGSIDILRDQGMVGLASEGRRASIDKIVIEMNNGSMKIPNSVGLFFKAADKRVFSKFAVLFVGIVKPEGTFQWPLKRQLIIGETLKKDEIEVVVKSLHPNKANIYEDISDWSLRQIHQLIHL